MKALEITILRDIGKKVYWAAVIGHPRDCAPIKYMHREPITIKHFLIDTIIWI